MKFGAVALIMLMVFCTLLLADWLAKKNWLPRPIARKMLHVAGVGACTVALQFFPNLVLLQILIAAFTVLLFVAVHFNWIGLNSGPRKSWGIALFPLAFFLLLVAFGRSQPWLVIYPMAILTLADAGAAVVGELFAKKFFFLSGDRKSWLGTATFAIITLVLLVLLPSSGSAYFQMPFEPLYSQLQWIATAVAVAVVLAAAEASCSNGFDNFVLPLLCAYLLQMVLGDNWLGVAQLPLGITLSAVVGLVAWQRRWLNAGAAVVAALLGVVLWLAGGAAWSTPMLSFFVVGSLLSKLPTSGISGTDSKHKKPRDWQQVLCNGGVAGVCAVGWGVTQNEVWVWGYCTSIAISMADTCASELGMRFGGRPFDVVGLKPLPVGVSGGISLLGTLGGLVGALFIATICHFLVQPSTWYAFWPVAGAGFLGMLVDSVLGSRVQAKYGSADAFSDTPLPNQIHEAPTKGVAWLSNDLVNIFSNAIVVAAAMLYWWAIAKVD